MFYHVARESSQLFCCYSNEADYCFYVSVDKVEDVDKAMEIAERELTRWGGPDEEELGDDYGYYYNAGYVEVVENAFNKEGIDADFYTKYEKEAI